ncbi:MAG: HAD family hydrolase [Ardenticatenaceae bacterium]|nr:HAD family hydrolase [Ardenticatenaceae bacterium]
MAIRAVIFDRDGVLTEFDIDAAEAFLQPRLHMPLIELAQRWVKWSDVIGTPKSEVEEGDLFRGFWTYISDLVGVSEAVRQELFDFDYLGVIRPFADAAVALQYCKQMGLKVGVLSNFSLATLDQSLAAGGLGTWVDYAAAAPVIGYAKPQAESYQHIAQKLDVLPDECLLLDDDPAYVAGAQAVGMHTCLVNRRLLAHDLANGVLKDLTALPTALERAV